MQIDAVDCSGYMQQEGYSYTLFLVGLSASSITRKVKEEFCRIL